MFRGNPKIGLKTSNIPLEDMIMSSVTTKKTSKMLLHPFILSMHKQECENLLSGNKKD